MLLTPAPINRLDKAEVQRKRVQIRLSAKQVERYVRYTGGFIGMLASLAARAIPLVARARDLQLVYFRVVLTKRLVAKVLLVMDSIYINMINAIEYRK